MLPAELYETKNRGTCYGIAAACGKLGAIIVQIVIKNTTNEGADKEPLVGLLFFLVPSMLLEAFIAAIWIPEGQIPNKKDGDYSKYENRSLENIAGDPTEYQKVGFRANMSQWRRLHG